MVHFYDPDSVSIYLHLKIQPQVADTGQSLIHRTIYGPTRDVQCEECGRKKERVTNYLS